MARRPTTWVDTIMSRALVNGGQQTQSLILEMSAGDKRQATVIRTIIQLSLHSSTVAGAWGVQRVDIGMGLASQESFTAGVVPDPNVATDKPIKGWMWRTSVLVSQNGIGTPITVPIVADVRGARKIEQGELYMVANSISVDGTTFTCSWDGLVRVLIKI